MPKIYSKAIKQRARNLRRRGYSLGEISLKMSIRKNTLSGWVKDIRLTESQRKRIKEKEIACAAMSRPLALKANRIKIEKWKEGIRKKAKDFGKLPFKNKKMAELICGLLYLCEGAKYPSTRGLIFGNSEPSVIRCFLNLLRIFFNIKENKLRCRIMYRWDQDIGKLNKYWSNVTGIPLNQFFKTKPDMRTKGKTTQKINYKGVCAIQYSDTSLQFQLQAIGEAIMNGGADGIRTRDTSMPC